MAAAAGSAVFVLGGVNAAGVTISDVGRITPATSAVTTLGALAEPTHGGAAVTVGGRILVFGGAATTVHTSVQSFNPATGTTRVIGSLPGPRADLAAAAAAAARCCSAGSMAAARSAASLSLAARRASAR
jgi:hypothetical protein